MLLEDYVVLVEYSGQAPVCCCGLCAERPVFYRGKFKRYAAGHDTFEKRKELYTLKYGTPTCLTCKSSVGFHRGKPKKYCSFTCQGKQNGFSKPEIQSAIRKVVRERYGVDNISKLPNIQVKISQANIGRIVVVSDETRRKHSINSKKMWADPDTKECLKAAIKQGTNTPEERERRSKFQKDRMNNPEYVEKLFGTCWGKLSKLHQRFRIELELDKLGFVSEQIIGNRLVDELHPERKIVIEINGDYIHANPKRFKAEDIIRIPGEAYTAQEKWKRDQCKLEYLRNKGYRVYVVWESDVLEHWKELLKNL